MRSRQICSLRLSDNDASSNFSKFKAAWDAARKYGTGHRAMAEIKRHNVGRKGKEGGQTCALFVKGRTNSSIRHDGKRSGPTGRRKVTVSLGFLWATLAYVGVPCK